MSKKNHTNVKKSSAAAAPAPKQAAIPSVLSLKPSAPMAVPEPKPSVSPEAPKVGQRFVPAVLPPPPAATTPQESPAAALLAPKPFSPPLESKSLVATSVVSPIPCGQPPREDDPPRVNATFVLCDPQAKQVSLCGEFNGWSSETMPMERQDGGRWERTLALPPGRYQYKFVVDGQWIPDPKARENMLNPHGSLNSVMVVQA
jgi:hypothetical protein